MEKSFGKGMAWTRLRWRQGPKGGRVAGGRAPGRECAGQVEASGLGCWSAGLGGLQESVWRGFRWRTNVTSSVSRSASGCCADLGP